jgi:hypothetical protein
MSAARAVVTLTSGGFLSSGGGVLAQAARSSTDASAAVRGVRNAEMNEKVVVMFEPWVMTHHSACRYLTGP